ncbi:MAG: cobalamin biosynthesis protein CbiD [Ruminococcus sp.]|nr:cobalamin biosynthesis protein CbiD [Ruminococcus sp.]
MGGECLNEKYIYSGTQKLRCGYTTGSCATAAAMAAAEMLLGRKKVDSVSITVPSGDTLTIPVIHQNIGENSALCAVVKDSGDDPDITNGIEVFAEVSLTDSGITIRGGEGVGKVTKAGLDQPVGEWAINSVPRRMMTSAVTEIAEIYGYSGGLSITVSVPKGEELARKTFNPRMGIIGGISIIGTTGIVEPMSSSAMIGTIRAEANMRKAAGYDTLLLTVGNYSEELIRLKAGTLSERTVTCSNFIGDAIDIAISLKFGGILIIGHIGKLVKLGSGIMNTHSSYADGRMETLIACGAIAGVESRILAKITDCATVDAALDILTEHSCTEAVLKVLTERINAYLSARTKGEADIGAVIFSNKHDLMLKTEKAEELMKRISEE